MAGQSRGDTHVDSTSKTIVESFREKRKKYKSLTKKATRLIKKILHEEKIECIYISSRTKTEKSLIEKLRRKETGLDYYQHIEDIEDLSGARIVLFDASIIDKIVEIIKEEFANVKVESKGTALEPDRFGYLGVHVTAQMKTSNDGKFARMRFEVQIRSALQNAWANISHRIFYKHENSIPNDLKRQLHLMAGLFEVGDNLWQQVIDTRQKMRARIRDEIMEGIFEQPLDTETLSAFFESQYFSERSECLTEKHCATVLPAIDHEECMYLVLSAAQSQDVNSLVKFKELMETDENPTMESVFDWYGDWLSNGRSPLCWHMLLSLAIWGCVSSAPSKEAIEVQVTNAGWALQPAQSVFDVVSEIRDKYAQFR